MAFGASASIWLAAGVMGATTVISLLAPAAALVSVFASSYTAFLFAQGLARDLWQGPYAAVDLLAQSVIEGSAVLLLAAPFVGSDTALIHLLQWALLFGIGLHLLLLVFEQLTPSPTRHHELAPAAIVRGAYARLYWGAAPLPAMVAVVALVASPGAGGRWVAAALALASAYAWEHIWVEAGQRVPNS